MEPISNQKSWSRGPFFVGGWTHSIVSIIKKLEVVEMLRAGEIEEPETGVPCGDHLKKNSWTQTFLRSRG